ncbi:MAG TPA: undecaprenyl-diphosphate phosphatase [Alphaproteobacteria bacterium]
MTLLHLFILSVVQGITEFLPISSSAHLILVPYVLHMPDQGLMIDVGAHLGTLAAVMLYFHQRLAQMWRGVWEILLRKPKTFDSKLVWCLVIGTIPGLIGGAVIMLYDDTLMRHVWIIGTTSIVFGILLWVADKRSVNRFTIETGLTYKNALYIGLAQLLALIPGTSRSGITMTAARLQGFERSQAARFSMLLSIPVTAAAVLAYLAKMVIKIAAHEPIPAADIQAFFITAVMTFFVALGAIHFLLKWLQTHDFTIFVLYRLILGVAIWVTILA